MILVFFTLLTLTFCPQIKSKQLLVEFKNSGENMGANMTPAQNNKTTMSWKKRRDLKKRVEMRDGQESIETTAGLRKEAIAPKDESVEVEGNDYSLLCFLLKWCFGDNSGEKPPTRPKPTSNNKPFNYNNYEILEN